MYVHSSTNIYSHIYIYYIIGSEFFDMNAADWLSSIFGKRIRLSYLSEKDRIIHVLIARGSNKTFTRVNRIHCTRIYKLNLESFAALADVIRAYEFNGSYKVCDIYMCIIFIVI